MRACKELIERRKKKSKACKPLGMARCSWPRKKNKSKHAGVWCTASGDIFRN